MTQTEASKDENLRPLRDWLAEHSARIRWSVDIPQVGFIQAYEVNGHIILIQGYEPMPGDWQGWEAYTTVEPQDIEGTLHALAAACRL